MSMLDMGDEILLQRIVYLLLDISENPYNRRYRSRDIYDLVESISYKVADGSIPINLKDYNDGNPLGAMTLHGNRSSQLRFLEDVANYLAKKKFRPDQVAADELKKKLDNI